VTLVSTPRSTGSLAALTDVDVASVMPGQVLAYGMVPGPVADKWVPITIAGGGVTLTVDEFVATADGAQSRPILNGSPTPPGIDLTINGMDQPTSSTTVVGTSIVIPSGMNVLAGDLVRLSY